MSSLHRSLWEACRDNKVGDAEALISRGADINWVNSDHYGHTPLGIALREYHKDIARFLLTIDELDCNIVNSNGHTMLWMACAHRAGEDIVSAIALKTSDININKQCGALRDTPIMIAVKSNNIEAVRVLGRIPRVQRNMYDLTFEARFTLSDSTSMLQLLEKLDQEEEPARKAEISLKEDKRRLEEEERRLKEEKRRKEEKLREKEQAQQAKLIKNEERKKREESLKQAEMSKEFQVDEATFASLCKKSTGDKIAKCLEYNRDLLNCRDGLPLREAARGANIEVVDILLGTSGIQVNLQSKQFHIS